MKSKNEKKEDYALMRGEFYSANEYNSISEYKHFPAEMYVKPKEENLSGKEESELGNEVTTLQPKRTPKSRTDSQKTVTDKILESIRSVATSSVVVASVVVTSAVAASPEAKLISLDYGDAYVEYQMEVTGLDDEGDYAIVLSADGEEDIVLEVDGDGTQSRCFCHVADVVRALRLLLENPESYGNVYNIGSTRSISIEGLAQLVIERTGSKSEILRIPYEKAYAKGFEDMMRRRPDTTAIHTLTGWQAEKSLEEIIDDVAASLR